MNTLKMYVAPICTAFFLAASSHAMDLTLAWNKTSTSTDGTPINNVTAYRLYYGATPGVYDNYVEVSGSTAATVSGLEYNKGYFFAVKAIVDGVASAFSSELAWVSPVMADTDTDGLSDDWELDHAGTLSAMTANTDMDNDGVSDLDEFIAGSNPADAQDAPAIAIHAAAPGVTVSFNTPAASGPGYQNRARYVTLMKCDDLTSGNWTPVPGCSNILASGQTETIALDASQQGTFYRTDIDLQ